VASRADRAKIFLPFAALDGLEEALAEAELLAQAQAETIQRVWDEELPPDGDVHELCDGADCDI